MNEEKKTVDADVLNHLFDMRREQEELKIKNTAYLTGMNLNFRKENTKLGVTKEEKQKIIKAAELFKEALQEVQELDLNNITRITKTEEEEGKQKSKLELFYDLLIENDIVIQNMLTLPTKYNIFNQQFDSDEELQAFRECLKDLIDWNVDPQDINAINEINKLPVDVFSIPGYSYNENKTMLEALMMGLEFGGEEMTNFRAHISGYEFEELKILNNVVNKEYKPKEYPTIDTYPSNINIENQFAKLEELRKLENQIECNRLMEEFSKKYNQTSNAKGK